MFLNIKRNISWQKVFDHPYDAIIISKFRTFLEKLKGLIYWITGKKKFN